MRQNLNFLKVFSFAVILLLFGCREEFKSINEESNNEINFNSEFFSSKSHNINIINQVREINDKTNFISKISDKKGKPFWEEAYKTPTLSVGKNSYETLIIPLIDEEKCHLTSLLFIENANSETPHIYTITNHQLYQYLLDNKNKKNDKENLMTTFLHFSSEIFEHQNFYNIPPQLFSDYLKGKDHKSGTLHIFGKKSSSPTAKDSVFCLIVEDCHGCTGGTCDGCGICTKSICYSLGGGYDTGGGDFGDQGPYNGGTSPGSGGGTTAINAPWYLNSGIDMNLYTNHVRKIYFTLGNFGMFLNQSQVDFLQERLDVTSMFNYYFDSAASLNEAKFAFWGIQFFISDPETTTTEMKAFINTQQTYKDEMSVSEKNIYNNLSYGQQLNYLMSAYQALSASQNIYGTQNCTLSNGKGDAFRHTYWNALCRRRLGLDITNQLTTAHEDKPFTHPNQNKEKEMDLYNNSIGMNLIYNEWATIYTIQSDIKTKLNEGVMKYINNLDSECKATNSSTLIQTNQ